MHHSNFGNFYTREIYAIPIPIGFIPIPIPIPIMSRMSIPIPMGFPWEWDSHGVLVSHSHAHLYSAALYNALFWHVVGYVVVVAVMHSNGFPSGYHRSSIMFYPFDAHCCPYGYSCKASCARPG